MNNYILSIVIPVYNVEKYIKECLDSIFSQLPETVEIIIVNDGTPDHSVEIIINNFSKWLQKDQVIMLEQDNAGPGAARNYGLSMTRGEYIGFLDSDDILFDKYFIIILDAIKSYKLDIVEFGFQRFHQLVDLKTDTYKPLYTFEGLYALKKVRNEIFALGAWFPSTRVYKKDIFKNRQFPVGVFYEDLMTIPHVFLEDLKAYFIPQPLIGYRFNPKSTTSMHDKSHAMDMYSFYLSLKKFDRTIPIEILKIRTARGLAYFYNELEIFDLQFADVIKDIKRIRKSFELIKILTFPDRFFFILPSIYMLVDKIRLRNKTKTT
ncbi:Glycosyltransferase involved in cell wall bisynthesis [Candidatus Electrothrix laxa]